MNINLIILITYYNNYLNLLIMNYEGNINKESKQVTKDAYSLLQKLKKKKEKIEQVK